MRSSPCPHWKKPCTSAKAVDTTIAAARAEHAQAHTQAGADRPLPRLVPAVLFGRTRETLHHGRGAKHLLNERVAGLVSKPSDAFDWEPPPGPANDALFDRWEYFAKQPYNCSYYCRDIPGERRMLLDPEEWPELEVRPHWP
jgi:hypothetical protein